MATKVALDLAISEFSIIFVLNLKTNKTQNDMAKVQKNLRNSLLLEIFFDYGAILCSLAQTIHGHNAGYTLVISY